jgi:hypothetical protein
MKLSHLALLAIACSTYGLSQKITVETIANPSGEGSIQANWTVMPDGSPLLSWVTNEDDGSMNLAYSVRKGGQWSKPRVIVTNREFFRHPAEVPGVIALADGTLLAHWVEMPEDADDAEFLWVSASHDGIKWSKPVMAHKDRSMVQHGLASMVASGPKEASLMWLEALEGEDGPVALKRTVINSEGAVVKEESLDPDVCACCPTAIVKTAKGLLVAYRDHTAGDIRDIAAIRFENGKWTRSGIVSADNWKINACPTNAAAVSAKGDRAAISWYTAAGGAPKVQMVSSTDDGATFSKPVLVSTANTYGYTSVTLDDDGGAIVSWLEKGGTDSSIMVRKVSVNGVAGPAVQVAQGARRDLGYPKLVRSGGETLIAWSGSGSSEKLRTARLK